MMEPRPKILCQVLHHGQHAASSFHDRSVHVFRNTVMLWRVVLSWTMPDSLHIFAIVAFTNSVPLSVRMRLILRPHWFSAMTLNERNASATADFSTRKETNIFRKKSLEWSLENNLRYPVISDSLDRTHPYAAIRAFCLFWFWPPCIWMSFVPVYFLHNSRIHSTIFLNRRNPIHRSRFSVYSCRFNSNDRVVDANRCHHSSPAYN